MKTPSAEREKPSISRTQILIVGLALGAITCHLLLRFVLRIEGSVLGRPLSDIPLLITLAVGGTYLVLELLLKLIRGDFGSPGCGLIGSVSGRPVEVTSRKKLLGRQPNVEPQLAATSGGLECVVLIDGRYAATLRFRDQPRADGASFIRHLARRHRFDHVMLVSSDREAEVRYLADQVGISEVRAGQSPEQKLEIVRAETRKANTIYLGDGINDAPALTAATVGVAFGQTSDVTTEAAGAVIMDSSLEKVDEFLHIGRRLRAIALQSAVGGMALSLVGMALAAAGYLPPVTGAILQEVIDVLAVVNALRLALPPRSLTDY